MSECSAVLATAILEPVLIAVRSRVKNRMNGGNGMSFAEFSYPLLQGWDWWYMYQTKDIQVQVGGADQFGNILAGMDAVNHIRFTRPLSEGQSRDGRDMKKRENFLKHPMGFTVPLLTTSSGEKFGKSAGNAIWLDKDMTSPFDLYQVRYLHLVMNLTDRGVVFPQDCRFRCSSLLEAVHFRAA